MIKQCLIDGKNMSFLFHFSNKYDFFCQLKKTN